MNNRNEPIPDIQEILSDFPEFEGIHPIAAVFPMQEGEDFWRLVENITTYGVAHLIRREIGTNLLVDGRARLIACWLTGTLFEVEDIEPNRIYCLSTVDNLCSKQINPSQRAAIAARLQPFLAAETAMRKANRCGGNPSIEEFDDGLTQAERDEIITELAEEEFLAKAVGIPVQKVREIKALSNESDVV